MRKEQVLTATAAVLVGIMAGFMVGVRSGAVAQPTQSKLFEVLQRGHVIAGITSESPPFGMVDASGNLAGFDIDVARLVAKSLFGDPEKIELKRTAFPARWNAVNGGDIDFGIMQTTIWPDRLARVNFTRGYIRSGEGILARSDVSVRSPNEFNDPKYTMALLQNPTTEKLMKDTLPRAKVLALNSEADEITALNTHRADALLIDLPVAVWRAKNLPNLRYVGVIGPATQNAIFMRQNDFQWWWYLDTLVGEMRCGSLFEDYSSIYKKWFGIDPPSPESCLSFSEQDWLKATRGK